MITAARHGAAGARAGADYLYEGSVRLTAEQKLALDVMNDRMGLDAALEALEPLAEAEMWADFRSQLVDLNTAFRAVGEWNMAKVTVGLAALEPGQTDERSALMDVLRHAHAAYREAIDELETILGSVQARAWERLTAAMDSLKAEDVPIRMRPDTSPEMRELLGIKGNGLPDQETVRCLLSAKTADNDPIPGKHYATERPGMRPLAFQEYCFSAGKSVALEWALGQRDAVRKAHDAAVEAVMTANAERVGRVRMGKNGSGGTEAGEVTWITFVQFTSRFGDPDLHTHVAVPNVVRSNESERVGSLHVMQELRYPELRQAYQFALAENLRAAGLRAHYDRDLTEAWVEGWSQELQDAFSTRARVAEEEARRQSATAGLEYERMPEKDRIAWMRAALLTTRPPKELGEGDPVEWRERAERHGWRERQHHSVVAEVGHHRGGSDDMDWSHTRQRL